MSQNDPLLGNDWLEKDEPISGQSVNALNGLQTNNNINNKSKTQLNDKYFDPNNSLTISNNTNNLLANNTYNSSAVQSNRLMSAIGMSSSDSSTDDIVIPMQRRKVKTRFARKRRSHSTDSNLSIKSRALISCPSICLKIILVVMIVSSIAFTILFIAKLYDRIDSLQTAINDLRTSGNIVPEEMHSIHSHLKTLDSNMSSVVTNLSLVVERIDNLTQEVKQMKVQMTKISDSVEAAPAIRQLPKELQDLQKVVAEMGSRLTTNDNEVKTMKEKQNSDQTKSDSLLTELTAIKANITELYSMAEHNNISAISYAKLEQSSNQLIQMTDNFNKLQMLYTGLVNWKAQAEAQIGTLFNLTHHIHEKLHNESLTGHSNDPKHESHYTNEPIVDINSNKSNINTESTTGRSLLVNQTTNM